MRTSATRINDTCRWLFLAAGILGLVAAALLPVNLVVSKAIPENVVRQILERGTPERVTFLQEQLRTGLLYLRVTGAVFGAWLILLAACWRLIGRLAAEAPAWLHPAKPVGSEARTAGRWSTALWMPLLWTLLAVLLSIPVMRKGFEHEELLVMEMMAKRGALATMASQNLPPRAAQPAYTVIESFVVRYWGDAEWQVRVPAVVFGALTMVPLFLIARRFGGLLLANMACGLLGTTAFYYFYINYARGYPLALLLYWVTLWLAMVIREDNSWRNWLWMGVAIFIGCYAHMAMGVYVAVLCLIMLADRLRMGWQGARWGGMLAVLAQPVAVWGTTALLLITLYSIGEPANQDYLSKFDLTSYYMAYHINWRFLRVMTELWAWVREVPPLAWTQFALFLTGVALMLRKRLHDGLCLVLPPAASVTVFGVLGLFVYPRYFLFFIPLYALLAAYGSYRLLFAPWQIGHRMCDPLGRVPVALRVALLILLFGVCGSLGMRRLYVMERCGVRTAVEDARAAMAPGETLAGVLDAFVTVQYYHPETVSMFRDTDFWSVLQSDDPPAFIISVPYLDMDIPGGTTALLERYDLYRHYESWLDVDDDQDSVYLYRLR